METKINLAALRKDAEAEQELLTTVGKALAALGQHYDSLKPLDADTIYRIAHCMQLIAILEVLRDLNDMKMTEFQIKDRLATLLGALTSKQN